MFDLVHMTMRHAVVLFGGRDRIFNGACFAQAFRQTSGVDALLDGRQVMAILCGRRDVEILGGGSHYKLIKQNDSDRKADEAIRRLEEALSKSHGFKSGDWVRVIRTEDELSSVHPVGSRRKIDEILDDTIAFVGHTLCLKVGYVVPCERPTYKPGDWVRVIVCSERGIPTTEHPVGSKRCVKEVMSIRDRFVLKFEDRNFVRFLCCIDSEMVEPCEKPRSFEEIRTALREAGAKDWDNIEDPVQFLKELRGED